MQRLEFTAGLRFRVRTFHGQIVEVQDYPVLRTGTPALVNPVELLIRRGCQFEIDVTGKAAKPAIYGDPALGRQSVCQRNDLFTRQGRR